LIDSWAWIEYWRGAAHSREAAGYIDGDEEALASPINLAEVYYWFLREYDRRTADERRNVLERRCRVVPLEGDLAVAAAHLRKDEHLSLADSIILATARESGASLVTGDPDLRGKRGVVFIGS
jgi:predicted nucleic acid-binding protein